METHSTEAITPDDIHQFCSTHCYMAWQDTIPDPDEDMGPDTLSDSYTLPAL